MPTDPSPPIELLSHEKLDAYQVAISIDALVVDVCRRAPKGHAWLLDQLQRASGSTVLNLVEANGRAGADRLQLLRVAKGSALEVDAAFELLQHRAGVSPEERSTAHRMTVQLVRILMGLLRR